MASSAAVPVEFEQGKPMGWLHSATGWLFLLALAGFTLVIGDYSQRGIRIVSVLLFAIATLYLASNWRTRIHISLPFLCPFLMFLYGVGQTLWSPQKIVYNGLDKCLFWFICAAVALLGAQLFQDSQWSRRARLAIAIFGSAEALLDVLQQASHTGNYFWLIPSGFPDVYGTFAYYNNFAQFIELTLPVTLWEGIGHRQPRIPFLMLAAVQIGAVVACGSRAGAALVLLELFGVLLLAWFKRRKSIPFYVPGFALLASLGFVYVAGFEHLASKLQLHDQFGSRRLINQASIQMIKARPLSGWGLGAYAPAYKQFAVFDDGTWINQAHNDYLEWAAEGGVFYAAIMLVLILCAIRPALRSVWGFGLLAFAVHALVDYPFARLGTCGWYFALAAMLWATCGDDGVARHSRQQRSQRRELPPAEASKPVLTSQAVH